ncbi:2-hydroxycarboxylate transporter family protein [Paenibacillus camerounensis]|uniref:2-hydroxycarboxylate transporter family protein n=1 Tax=Paenibacillus camerounensis TaxID=1243663 RepID=UPI0006941077|nr:2-hydroxycarboxylate transporter family protein [Paenibacillus camerounensis]
MRAQIEKTELELEGANLRGLPKFMAIKFYGIPLSIYLFGVAVVLLGLITGSLPKDIAGSIFLVFTCGLVLGKIGDNLPIWKDYLGGGAIMAFLVTSWSVYAGIIPSEYAQGVNDLFDGIGFLDLYIAIIIAGALLSIDKKFLLKTIGGFIPMVLIATMTGFVGAALGGLIAGISPKEALMNYALPIMGGGNGAGAIPLSQIWGEVTGKDPKIWYSSAVSILTIANIIAIICAALLNGIGKKVPKWTGNGELIKGAKNAEETKKSIKTTLEDGAVGVFVTLLFYAIGNILGTGLLPKIGGILIHPYAYMVIIMLIANALDLIPERAKAGARQVNKFMSGNLYYVMIAGVGISMVDFGELIHAVNINTLVIAVLTVLGAMSGAWFFAKIVGFYEVESTIAAALCHVNRGGSGDLEVLGAAKRMNLMAYAQIATRLGGALVLIIGSFIFSFWAH